MFAYSAQAIAGDLAGILIKTSDGYALSDSLMPVTQDHKIVRDSWPFALDSLEPAFGSRRFECVINNKTKEDGCAEYWNQESKFVQVNRFKSGYGDTPTERHPNGKPKSGMTTGDVIGGAIMAPYLVLASPVIAIAKATEDTTRKWVEFDHITFVDEVKKAIEAKDFKSAKKFQDAASKLVLAFHTAEALSNEKKHALQLEMAKASAFFKDFGSYGIRVPSTKITVSAFEFQPLNLYVDADEYKAKIAADIDTFYANQLAQFNAAHESDKSALVPEYTIKVEARNKANAERAKREQAEALERARLAKIESDRLEKRFADFRKTLKIGSDTFCGPVIELRHPMVKIAVSAQLKGFATEAWLKTHQLFPPEYGCRNSNGNLSPL